MEKNKNTVFKRYDKSPLKNEMVKRVDTKKNMLSLQK